MTPIYSKGAFAAMIVFDLTNKDTLQEISDWLHYLEEVGDVAKIIIGNKADLKETRQISFDEAFDYAQSLGINYCETSALSGEGVETAYEQLLTTAFELREANSKKIQPGVVEPKFQEVDNSVSCC